MRWLSFLWYKYLFSNIPIDSNIFKSVVCRLQKHKCGVVWYNIGGVEPDMHCKNCGEDLG